jgi:hypothetical protein
MGIVRRRNCKVKEAETETVAIEKSLACESADLIYMIWPFGQLHSFKEKPITGIDMNTRSLFACRLLSFIEADRLPFT